MMSGKMKRMMKEDEREIWYVLGESVRGASHKRSDLPNQDAIDFWPDSKKGSSVFLAVSDGHGSSRSFRSNRGSKMAVTVAKDVWNSFYKDEDLDPTVVKRSVEEELPKKIVRDWRKKVADDLTENFLSPEELKNLEDKSDIDTKQKVILDPVLAYGATLLAVIVHRSFIIYIQNGDGEIFTINDEGEISRPLPGDEKLIANETTSLCLENAWRDFRVNFQPLSGKLPTLIFVSTDGYLNSFTEKQGFYKAGLDILEMIRTYGPELVEKNMKTWLEDASKKGSGDDITVGVVCRMT